MEKTSMRKIRDIIRLHSESGLSANRIALSLNVARSVVQECLRRIRAAELTWPLPADLDDNALESKLYPRERPVGAKTPPDWPYIHQQLRRKAVTLELLWHEYQAQAPMPYSYGQFCHLYRKWANHLNLVMRQDHKAGDKLFVDWSGKTASVTDPETGEVRQAQVFVAVWGASNYTYAEACWSQEMHNWIGAHVRAFEYFGGVPALVVPDCTKTAITKYDRWDPDVNLHYSQMARHYGTAILPARPRRPKDKAKVEKGVQVVQRWILAVLRNQQFFSLEELNGAIARLLEELNHRKFKKFDDTRATLFHTIDKPAMKPLPQLRYEDDEWRKAKVHPDYHIEVKGHYYSVPYMLVGKVVEVRVTPTVVECFHDNIRVASHKRDGRLRKHSTYREHMPRAHQSYLDWTPERLVSWAAKFGPSTTKLIKTTLESTEHPQLVFRRCLAVLSLEKHFGCDRVEAACRRALTFSHWSCASLRSMLKHGLEEKVVQLPILPPLRHENVRGREYYVATNSLTENESS